MKNYWLKSGLLSLMEKFSVQVFAFGSVFFLFRGLSKEAFGAWAIFLTIAAIIEVARIGLLQNALVKHLSVADETEYAKITTASLFINLLITSLTVLSLFGLAEPVAIFLEIDGLAPLLRIYALTNICLFPFFQLNYIQQANLDFKGIFWSNFARQGVFFAFVLSIFLQNEKFDLIALAEFQIVSALVGSVVAFIFCKKFLRFSISLDWHWVKELLRYGIFVFGTNATTQLFKSTDKFLLGKIPVAGPVGVAIYEAAIKITNLTDVPTFSMASILFPQSARRAADGNNGVKNLYEKAVGAILAFMIPAILLVWIFAHYIIWFVAGAQYLDAVPILRITMLYGLFMPFAVQFGTVLDSIGLPKINFYFTLANLILLGAIDYFFIWGFGTIGAAYGTLLAYAVSFVYMQFYLHKKLKTNPLNAFFYMVEFYKKGIFHFQNLRLNYGNLKKSKIVN